jgi:hypothetical protein
VIKLNECELDYPSITRFKVWVGKVYMGEYDKAEMVKRFGDKWLDMGIEKGVRWVEVYLI